MKRLALLLACGALGASAAPRMVTLPGKSPLITLRFVFTTGAASDPAPGFGMAPSTGKMPAGSEGKPGVAHLTGEMLAGGGTKDLTYKQVTDALYPMASSINVYSDKEMTTFIGATHVDNLDKFYGLMRDAILHPGWRADDFERVRDDSLNALRVTLRGNNDEELGKEELYNVIYAGRPYGHEDLGTGEALQKMTLADLQAFYRAHYTQANLIIGIAGGYPADFAERVKRDFAALPAGPADRFQMKAPAPVTHNRLTLIEKDTRSVAWSFGYPIDVKRGDPDYPALLVAQSYLGQHRQGGRLFTRLREARGLNYGDYAYIEYFPRGMNLMEPQPNLARQQQIFQIWIRPVETPDAGFALRAGLFELNKLVKEGIPPAEFERTRGFLSKFVNVLTKTKSAELGYAIDSLYYGIPGYNDYLKSGLAKLTAEDVNKAVRKHLRAENIEIVGVTKDAAKLAAELTGGEPTLIHYNSPKPADILDEDKTIERWPLHLRAEDVKIVPVGTVFEN
ncbi:MAG TPA: pitrilysin family protein [Bryobacteraceae bacterium]|jgi:zinc protease|nr:pitrilysin family protein [Bryobacteraceae bacterium]